MHLNLKMTSKKKRIKGQNPNLALSDQVRPKDRHGTDQGMVNKRRMIEKKAGIIGG
jgi:hypothetical protein